MKNEVFVELNLLREKFLRALIDDNKGEILHTLGIIQEHFRPTPLRNRFYCQVVLENPEAYIQCLQRCRQAETRKGLLQLINVDVNAGLQFRGLVFQRLLALFEEEMQEFGYLPFIKDFFGLLVFCKDEIYKNRWYIEQYWQLFLKQVKSDDDIDNALELLHKNKDEIGHSMISPLFTLLLSKVWTRRRFFWREYLPSLASTVYKPGTDSLRRLSREDRLLLDAIFGVRSLLSSRDGLLFLWNHFCICNDCIPYREYKLFLVTRSRSKFPFPFMSERFRVDDCLVARTIVDLLNRDDRFNEHETAGMVELLSLESHLDASLRSSLASNDRFQLVSYEFFLVPE